MEKIVICAFGRAGYEVINKLLLDYHKKNILIFTTDDKRNNDFLNFLKYLKIEYSTENVNKYVEKVNKFKPNYLLSIYYPHIIKEKIIKIVNNRAINLHPSLLPKYKGCFSAPWVILNNEKKTGISYHYIIKEVDKGNILLQDKVRILKYDTAYSLYHKLITSGINNFNEAFKRLKEGVKGKINQGEGSYYKREVPWRGYIDLKWSRAKIHRFIRALYFPPFKGAILKYKNNKIEFLSPEDFDKFTKINKINIPK